MKEQQREIGSHNEALEHELILAQGIVFELLVAAYQHV